MKELNINQISKKHSQNIKIGELSQEVIDLLNLNLYPQNIYIWPLRINEHCEKHKNEYSSFDSYNKTIKSIPLIIKNPDYVGLHKNGNIQYIKKLDDISLVGIKVLNNNKTLLFRTIFPISETKLKNSIKSKKFISLKKRDT